MGRNLLVTRFLSGALRLRPASHSRVPAWHLDLGQLRALDNYVHRAALRRKTDQLFVCFGLLTLRRWRVKAVSLAYESSDLFCLWGSERTQLKVLRLLKLYFQGCPCRTFVTQWAGPPCSDSSDSIIWTRDLRQALKFFCHICACHDSH